MLGARVTVRLLRFFRNLHNYNYVPNWNELLSSTGTPPPPIAQNPENKLDRILLVF